MFSRLRQLLFAVMLAAGFSACNSSGNKNDNTNEKSNAPTAATQAAVAPPLAGIDVPFTEYIIKPTGRSIIRTHKGSVIEVPEGAFVDANGNPPKGEVTVKFREFHSIADILVSGITMKGPGPGQYLESAGMFEIRANSQGQELQLAHGKDIKVDIASDVNDGRTYDFWVLHEENGLWDKIGNCPADKVVPNQEKIAVLRKVDAELAKLPTAPKKMTNEDLIFNVDVSYTEFPELRTLHGVMWEAANPADQKQIADVLNKEWESVKLNQTDMRGEYSLNLKNEKDEFDARVRPVLKGKNYEAAMASFEKDIAAYKKTYDALTSQKTMAEAQGNVVRSFRLQNLGIFNWDFCNEPGRMQVKTNLSFDPAAGIASVEESAKVKMYLIMSDKKAVVPFYDNSIAYYPEYKNAIVAVLPDGKIAICPSYVFKAQSPHGGSGTKVLDIPLTTLDRTFSTPEALQELLAPYI